MKKKKICFSKIDIAESCQKILERVRKDIKESYPELNFVTKKDMKILEENPLFSNLIKENIGIEFIKDVGLWNYFIEYFYLTIPCLRKEGIDVKFEFEKSETKKI